MCPCTSSSRAMGYISTTWGRNFWFQRFLLRFAAMFFEYNHIKCLDCCFYYQGLIVRFGNYKDKLIVWDAKFKITDHRYFISDNFSRNTEFKRRKLYAIYKKAKSMDQYKKKSSLNGDVLIIDSVRYSVDSLNMLPKELSPRQFSEKAHGIRWN